MRQILSCYFFLFTLTGRAQIVLCSADYDSALSDKANPRIFVDVAPSFTGGDEGLRTFLNASLTPYYDGINKASVRFIIDTLGQVKNVCIISDINRQELNENENKIINVIKNMPKWTPGFSQGKKTPVHFTIPIKKY